MAEALDAAATIDERRRPNADLLDEVDLDAGCRRVRPARADAPGRMDRATTSTTTASSHTRSATRSSARAGIHSVIAAPLIQRDDVLGAITSTAIGRTPSTTSDAGVLAGLADQAAVAIAKVSLIEELERSRAEIARRADAERTLREIAARVSAILDPAEVLQRIVDEAARLLDSDGARIDLYDPEIGALRWAYAAGDAMADVPDWGQDRRPQAAPGGGRPGLRRAARRS